MEDQLSNAKKAIQEDINAFEGLKKINQSKEFDAFFELLYKTVADKMVWTFIGDNVKSYEDFLKVRGEITSYLYPIQQIRSADEMVKALNAQLKSYYETTV